jgi:DNA-binding GntR family transcriptional regulator
MVNIKKDQTTFKSSKLRHTAYKAIKDKIVSLELRPGDQLSEGEIVKSLGIGRTPVREALLLLEKTRLIEIKVGSGFSICKFTQDEISDYRLLRTSIERLSLSLSIQRITHKELNDLKKNLTDTEKYITNHDLKNILKYESEFHELLYSSAKSLVLSETLSNLNTMFLWFRSVALTMKGAAEESLMQHKEIFRAIEKKDIEESQRLMDQHIESGWKRLNDIPWIFKDYTY